MKSQPLKDSFLLVSLEVKRFSMQDPLVSYFPQKELAAWLTSIQDSSTGKPLINSTLVVNCYHHVSGATLFGKTLCSQCQAPIVNCITDHHVIKLEGFILQLQNAAHETLFSLAKKLQEEPPPLLNSAHLPARFECVRPWGATAKSDKSLRASASWESITPHSLLKTLQINQHRNKTPEIIITCRSKYAEEFTHYLMLSGFSGPLPGTFKAQTLLELDFALQLIAEYSELADQDFSFAKQLVTREKTRQASSLLQLPNLLRRRSSNSPQTPPSPMLLESFKDSITNAFFENAVILIPCGHSFSENQARRLRQCTLCKAPVVEYAPNSVLRSIVERVRLVHTSLFIRIPESSQRVPEDPLPPIPFPGPSARFYYGERWHEVVPTTRSKRCRQLRLYSEDPDSFIEGIEVGGYPNGLIAMIIVCHKQYIKTFETYLAHFGIAMDRSSGICMARLSRELDWALRFCLNHNDLPEEALRRLEYFRDSRTWRLLGE